MAAVFIYWECRGRHRGHHCGEPLQTHRLVLGRNLPARQAPAGPLSEMEGRHYRLSSGRRYGSIGLGAASGSASRANGRNERASAAEARGAAPTAGGPADSSGWGGPVNAARDQTHERGPPHPRARRAGSNGAAERGMRTRAGATRPRCLARAPRRARLCDPLNRRCHRDRGQDADAVMARSQPRLPGLLRAIGSLSLLPRRRRREVRRGSGPAVVPGGFARQGPATLGDLSEPPGARLVPVQKWAKSACARERISTRPHMLILRLIPHLARRRE